MVVPERDYAFLDQIKLRFRSDGVRFDFLRIMDRSRVMVINRLVIG